MIRPIGDRFVFKGYTLEVVPGLTCDGCFFDDGSDYCPKYDDDFAVCGYCSSNCRFFSEGVVFKVVEGGGEA